MPKHLKKAIFNQDLLKHKIFKEFVVDIALKLLKALNLLATCLHHLSKTFMYNICFSDL